MRHIVNAVRVSDTLTKARETLRSILGDEYTAAIAPYREAVATVMQRQGASHIGAATALVEASRAIGGGVWDEMKILAATVDEIEAAP